MATDSSRRPRGWIYALVVAVCLIVMFFAGETLSRIKRSTYEVSPRKTTLTVSTKPRNLPRIVNEPIPIQVETLEPVLDRTAWANYRTEAPVTIAMIDPPAGVRLAAPIPTNLPDPFLESIQKPNNTYAVAENENTSIVARSVSVARPVLHETGPNIQPVGGTVLSKNWPASIQIASEFSKLEEVLAQHPNGSVSDWTARAHQSINALQDLSIYEQDSETALKDVGAIASEGNSLAREIISKDPKFAGTIARLAYSLERRVAVWSAVHQCVRTGRTQFVAHRNYEVDYNKLSQQLVDVRKALQATGDTGNWSNFLMLDELDRLASGKIESRDQQVSLAREVLSRVLDNRVTPAQRKFLSTPDVHKLADQIHPLTISPVDYRKLLVDIETLESNPVHRYSAELADAIQSLRFSEHEEQAAIATAIGVHYRNANVRVSIAQDFINRMMPKPQLTDRPVQQKILGADTRGASQVETQLKVKLIPDENAWHLSLNLDGNVNSSTRSSRNGATFYNSSVAYVNAGREIRIDPMGVQINGQQAFVESNDSLRKFSTEWDSLPILGDMVRHFAHQEFIQSRPIAKRIMQKMIAKQTDEEFDSQLRIKMKTARDTFDKRLLGPLQSLQLQPSIVEMKTFDKHMMVRYRVAGVDQISANTPRPIAPGDSQLSLQLHQSAINNLVGQVIESGRDWSLQELADNISDVLQIPHQAIPDDAPADVSIRFVDINPLTVEFEDGRMWLTLRVESFKEPSRGIDLKNFIVRTSFVPRVDGLAAELERESVLSVDGHRLSTKDRLPIRAVFTKVFSSQSKLPMVSKELLDDSRTQGLAISQMEMRDGWFAIAISEQNSPHVSTLKTNSGTR